MSRSFNASSFGTVILILATAAALWSINRGFPDLEVPKGPEADIVAPPGKTPNPNEVQDVTVRDLDGREVFRGSVDLSTTLNRISRGERLHYHDDGSTFQNREHRLPKQPAGYYSEYVHPTPNLSGPGPQRVVTGREGEVYYTPDHYRTFIRLR
jgi:guanyl-specific ribonuclease Sa